MILIFGMAIRETERAGISGIKNLSATRSNIQELNNMQNSGTLSHRLQLEQIM